MSIKNGGARLAATYAVCYVENAGRASGNNSVVECDLAKVEVAGSNPVSRSIISFPYSPTPYLRFPLSRRSLRPAGTCPTGAVAKW